MDTMREKVDAVLYAHGLPGSMRAEMMDDLISIVAEDWRELVKLLKDAMQLVDNANLWNNAPDAQWHMSADEVSKRYAALAKEGVGG